MFSFSPSERKVLILIAFLIFLGTFIRYYDLRVEEVVPSSDYRGQQPLKININEASAAELEKIPGIGPVLSRRIVEYRRNEKLFKEIDDLKKVKGIGEYKAKAIKKFLEF